MFARCFLLVFAELYVGGLLALSIPPFHQIERGFYKSTASVYLGAGLVAFAGRLALLVRGPAGAAALKWAEGAEMLLWAASLVAASLYLRGLWGEDFRARARHYVWAWTSGLAALAIGAQTFRLGPPLSIETILYPISFTVSALLLGAVTTGMLLGHWYLIDQGLSIDPFRHMLRFFVVMLLVQTVLLLVNSGLLRLLGTHASVASLTQLIQAHASLLTVRVLLSPVAAGALAWMIWKTLQIPQTMAATGLFYIAILSVLVGEFMARFILFRTSLPL
ncbi:MAG TPA: hypothetical protein VMW56_28135 [Candidatus Margulisiibacteriota bacterium]|nr:hypothetical protein [Candidatus Margulisiibacteriota bacterium]